MTIKKTKVADVGHNSGFAAKELVSFAERIERLTEEKEALAADMKEVYSEAKGVGFDTAILRKAIRLRQIPKAERQEADAVLDLYLSALEGHDRAEREQSEAEAE